MDNKQTQDFLAIIASSIHDMKNSLATLVNTVEQLSGADDIPSHHHSHFNVIQTEGNRLSNSFMQLLTLYRIENKQYFANINLDNVHDCLKEVQLDNETILEQRQLKLSVECPPGLEWYFDKQLLMGALNSLLNNACRYANQQIAISAISEDQQLIISISDDGPGYPESILEQAHKTQLDMIGGQTGLGLHFAATIVSMHSNNDNNGHIRLDNNSPLGGARLILHLP